MIARHALAAATAVAAACVCGEATALAAPPDWSGRYTVVTLASEREDLGPDLRAWIKDFSKELSD